MSEESLTTQCYVTPRGMGNGREAQEGGTYVYLWLIHADVCSNLHNTVKQLSSN